MIIILVFYASIHYSELKNSITFQTYNRILAKIIKKYMCKICDLQSVKMASKIHILLLYKFCVFSTCGVLIRSMYDFYFN